MLCISWFDYSNKWFAGKIKTVALTNFDTERLQIILENEIPVVSNQVKLKTYSTPEHFCKTTFVCKRYLIVTGVLWLHQVQHSIIDMRPQQRMAELCQLTGVKLITYVHHQLIHNIMKMLLPGTNHETLTKILQKLHQYCWCKTQRVTPQAHNEQKSKRNQKNESIVH